MIKAIETVYKGYRFRSRLEARWAVFFDALGVEWQYEPEGFELDNQTRYLPDFFLVESEIFIEIKPKINNKNYRTLKNDPYKWLGLSNQADKKLCVFFGEPNPYNFDALFTYRDNSGSWGWVFWRNTHILIFDGNTALLCVEPTGKDAMIHPIFELSEPLDSSGLIMPKGAYDTARQARFEHGEKP